jgi:hypothetical protein
METKKTAKSYSPEVKERAVRMVHERCCCTDPAGGAAGRAGVAGRPLTCPRMPSVPFKLNQDRRQHIPRQKRKVTNWREYDAGLRQRGSLTVWFTDEAVQAWQAEPRATRGGQPDYSPLAILTALTLRAVFRLPFRQTEGLIGSIIGLLGLDLAVPDHTTLCRRAATLEVPRPRPRSNGEPVHLLVDSTGLKLCGAGEWLIEKHGTRTRRSWRKLHIGMDANTGRIVTAVLTDKDADDGAQVGPLLDQADGPIASLTGDGAYDQRVSIAVSPSATQRRPSSCRRAQPLCPATRPRPRPHSATATCRLSPTRAVWDGRKHQATTDAPGSRPPWAGSKA